jgi:hypothetical protein
MVEEELPEKLVRELEARFAGKSEAYLKRLFGKLRIADNRRIESSEQVKNWAGRLNNEVDFPGGRVRVIDVSKQYPEIGKVVLKWDENPSGAKHTYDTLTQVVDHYNKHGTRSDSFHSFDHYPHHVEMAKGHVIGDRIIAMRYTELPTAREVMSGDSPRGNDFFEKVLKNLGITRNDVRAAAHDYGRTTNIDSGNIYVKGAERGRIHFIQAIDFE